MTVIRAMGLGMRTVIKMVTVKVITSVLVMTHPVDGV